MRLMRVILPPVGTITPILFSILLVSCIETGINRRSQEGARSQAEASASSKQAEACLNIVGGAPTEMYPEVFQIFYEIGSGSTYTCTGTFVSDNTMITAAHCMPISGNAADLQLRTNKGNPDLDTEGSGTRALSLLFPSTCPPSDMNDGLRYCSSIHEDIAVVIFPDRTAKSWLPIAKKTLPPRTVVTLVGYGRESNSRGASSSSGASDRPRKKYGANVLAPPLTLTQRQTFNPNVGKDSYTIYGWGAARESMSPAIGGQGDSGGPLLANRVILGVSSQIFTPETNSNIIDAIGFDNLAAYANLSSSTARQILGQAGSVGARVSYDDPENPGLPPSTSTATTKDSQPLGDINRAESPQKIAPSQTCKNG